MHRLVGHIGEDDAGGVNAQVVSLLPDVGFPIRWEPQQPEDRIWDAPQDVAPSLEGLWVVLVQLVAAGVHDLVVWQPNLRPAQVAPAVSPLWQ